MKSGIFLVHNNNPVRNSYLLDKIFELSKSIGASCFFFSWQPTRIEHSRCISAARSIMYFWLGFKWSLYRNDFSVFQQFKLFIGALKRIVFLLVFGDIKDRKKSGIECVVTSKHIRAWEAFVESECELGIFFEDDVVYKFDSVDNMQRLIDKMGEYVKDGVGAYFDLAGGLSESDLRVFRLEMFRKDGVLFYKLPVTNTACAYMINRQAVTFFLQKITINPLLRYVGIDWMMNSIFMGAKGDNFVCGHFSPPIFSHGTFSGDYVSWQKES